VNTLTETTSALEKKSVLEARNVRKSFPDRSSGSAPAARLEVLRGVEFSVHAGESVAIMGRSGCGKSTLLACLSGLDAVTEGEIWVQGQNFSQLLREASGADANRFRAQNIGIVFQQFQLLDHLTALENVRLPLDLAGLPSAQADRRAFEQLRRVGLSERADHFPDKLSRGECQRVAIARVLATGCPIVLADEPTGSLDQNTGEQVMDLLFATTREAGVALVLVTHDPQLAQRCDRRYAMREGRLEAEAPR
jgi:putative ABC transport system ATP-binding protein